MNSESCNVMAKKERTLKDNYRQILESKGIRIEDCKVLSFRFEERLQPIAFHYRIMSPGYSYYFFDINELVASVVISKSEPGTEQDIIKAAEMHGGKQITPQLW